MLMSKDEVKKHQWVNNISDLFYAPLWHRWFPILTLPWWMRREETDTKQVSLVSTLSTFSTLSSPNVETSERQTLYSKRKLFSTVFFSSSNQRLLLPLLKLEPRGSSASTTTSTQPTSTTAAASTPTAKRQLITKPELLLRHQSRCNETKKKTRPVVKLKKNWFFFLWVSFLLHLASLSADIVPAVDSFLLCPPCSLVFERC